MKKIRAYLFLAVALVSGIVGGFVQIRPNPRPSAENEAFQSIQDDIAQITRIPHMAGTPENYAVRIC